MHLKLEVKDLNPQYREKPPLDPRYFHFMEKFTPQDFHLASLITYTRPDRSEYVIKSVKENR